MVLSSNNQTTDNIFWLIKTFLIAQNLMQRLCGNPTTLESPAVI